MHLTKPFMLNLPDPNSNKPEIMQCGVFTNKKLRSKLEAWNGWNLKWIITHPYWMTSTPILEIPRETASWNVISKIFCYHTNFHIKNTICLLHLILQKFVLKKSYMCHYIKHQQHYHRLNDIRMCIFCRLTCKLSKSNN